MAEVLDGLGSTLVFGTSTTFTIKKIKITPPSIMGNDPTDITTLENIAWRTKYPKKLKDLGQCTFTGIWDTTKHVAAPVNINQRITFTDPAGATVVFYGALTEFASGDVVEGNFSECTGTITATNKNGTVETGPA